MKHPLFAIVFLLAILSCSSSDDKTSTEPTENMYFPPLQGDTWETKSPDNLNWNTQEIEPLLTYLETKHTKSFIVLVNGRVVMENYFNGQTATTPHYWASAGKTLTATVTGIAQQNGLLSINDKVSDHLGIGWTSMPLAKENLITVKNLLTMTSGIDDATFGDCVTPECLQFSADAGTRWAYHNVYVKLQDVVAATSGVPFTTYFNENLRDKIGMTGTWIPNQSLSVYWSTARSMARFGLLALNQGKWENDVIVNQSYFNVATNTSQEINKGYGYLWWLNGKQSFHLPQTQYEFPGSIMPNAPSDMFMALGKNDQKIYVIPSRKMVIIRMGDAADDETFGISDFDQTLWQKINAVIN